MGKIGNVNQLSKVLGNNSQIIANNTKIGTGKTFQAFGKEHKVTAPTAKSIKALPVHPQLARNMSSSTSGGGSNGSATNKISSNSTSTGSGTNSTKK